MNSTVLILPATLLNAGNSVAEAMGWGANNYSVPLQNSSGDLFYGLHAWLSDEFKSWVEGTSPLPVGMESAQIVIDALIYSFREQNSSTSEHFNSVLSKNGLVTMEQE